MKRRMVLTMMRLELWNEAKEAKRIPSAYTKTSAGNIQRIWGLAANRRAVRVSMTVRAPGQVQDNQDAKSNQQYLRYRLAQGCAPLHLRHQIADRDIDEARRCEHEHVRNPFGGASQH